MSDLTIFSLSKHGFKVEIVDEGLVATVDGEGYEATSPLYRIAIRQVSEGIAFTDLGLAFTSKVVFDEEGFWSWSDVQREVEEAAKALVAQDVINLIDYDPYLDASSQAPAYQSYNEADHYPEDVYHC